MFHTSIKSEIMSSMHLTRKFSTDSKNIYFTCYYCLLNCINKKVADSKYKALQYIDYAARKEQLTNPVQCSGEITPIVI